MSSSGDRKCGNKGCRNKGKHLCSGCGEEIYCSKECQKADWAAHKEACKSAVKPESAALLQSFDSLSVKQLKNIMKAKAASYEGKKREIVLSKLDAMVEKPNLVKFVQEHVELAEVETLLSVPVSETSGGSSSSSGNKPKGSRSSSTNSPPMPMPTPRQLREQARMMREQPSAVRRANAMFKNMTDQQIREYADQIEKAADDPAMMQEMTRMAKMTPRDRNQLQLLQEGLSGAKPMDAAWIDSTVATLKSNPRIFKDLLKGKGAMIGGVTDEQTASFVDSLAAMDAYILKFLLRALVFLGSLYKPATELYATVDNYTFGCARYLVLFVVMVVMYYLSMGVWFLLRSLFFVVYALYGLVMRAVSASAPAAAGAVKETVFQAPTEAAASGVGGLAAKVAAGAVASAGATAGAAALSGAAGAGVVSGAAKSAAAATAESADDEF